MPESAVAAIALGSNLPSSFGNPVENLREAVRQLGGLGTVVRVSQLHDTEPVGYRDQPSFVNAAAVIETTLTPLELLRGMLRIEHAMGRTRTGVPAKGPRTLDLDLLLYGDAAGAGVVMETAELTLPHPAMHERRFVLEPLAEIAPEWVHPGTRQSVAEMLAALQGQSLAANERTRLQ